MEELLDIDEYPHHLGESWQDEQTKPLMGRFEESSSNISQLLTKGEDLIILEREHGFEFISGFETEEQLHIGLGRDAIKSVKFLPVYKGPKAELSVRRILGFAFLFTLVARSFNAYTVLFGDEVLLGTILSVLLEKNRKQKRQPILLTYIENEQEEYLRLSFKSSSPLKERWKELWERNN